MQLQGMLLIQVVWSLWQLSLLVTIQQQLCEAFAPQGATLGRPFSGTTRVYRKSDSKWDDLSDDEAEANELDLLARAMPDMKYVPRNVQRQHQNFVAIREAAGQELTNDVYVPEPDSEVFWFVGKLARISDVSVEQAVARQWPLIVQHAANLRPLELFPSRAYLEVWIAPGDTELEVAYNRPNVVFRKMTREGVEGVGAIKSNMVGFQGETYPNGPGMGFRAQRTKDGRPAKPEIEGPETPDSTEEQYTDPKFRAPTDEELKELQKKLKDNQMSVAELYEAQQKRAAEETSESIQ
jgi:hypothetical protein